MKPKPPNQTTMSHFPHRERARTQEKEMLIAKLLRKSSDEPYKFIAGGIRIAGCRRCHAVQIIPLLRIR